MLTLDCDIYLQPNEFYEGNISYQIIEYKPLIADKYIVATSFFIEDRLLNQFESPFNRYVIEEWFKIHRGNSPKLDWFLCINIGFLLYKVNSKNVKELKNQNLTAAFQ